eukprot:4898548-Alexandrium_andersonii.AAC.1
MADGPCLGPQSYGFSRGPPAQVVAIGEPPVPIPVDDHEHNLGLAKDQVAHLLAQRTPHEL